MIKSTFNKWGDTWTLLERFATRALYHRKGANGERWELVGIGTHKKDRTWPNGAVTKAGTEYLRLSDRDYGNVTWTFLSRPRTDTL